MTRAKDAILQDLAREEQRLAELERTRDEARARIEWLRSELATASFPAPLSMPLATNGKAPYSPADKVKLFRSLFRGRPNIFPTRFVSKKTGKPGYAPACSNKWEPGLCVLKTGGKCSDCANQAFIPVGDQVVIDHLQGRHVMGVYPLLEDETLLVSRCRFRQGLVEGRRRRICRNLPIRRRIRRRSSAPARGTAHTRGSSSPRRYTRTSRDGWAATSLPRR